MFGYFVIYRVVFCNDTFTFMVMRRLLAVQTRETRPWSNDLHAQK